MLKWGFCAPPYHSLNNINSSNHDHAQIANNKKFKLNFLTSSPSNTKNRENSDWHKPTRKTKKIANNICWVSIRYSKQWWKRFVFETFTNALENTATSSPPGWGQLTILNFCKTYNYISWRQLCKNCTVTFQQTKKIAKREEYHDPSGIDFI